MKPPRAAQATWARPLALFCAAVGIPMLVQSVPGYAGPVALGYVPLAPQHYHLAILLTGFCLWLAQDEGMRNAPAPGMRSKVVACIGVAAAAALALFLTHPHAPATGLPLAQGVALSFAMYGSLLLPGVLTFGCLYPWSTARRCAWPAAACVLLGIVFMLCGVAAVVWHRPLTAPALALAGWLLGLIDPGNLSVDTSTAVIGFRSFLTYVGPQCAALDGVALFVVLAAVLWLRTPRVPARRAVPGIMAGAIILFLLNGVRIAAIVLIGTVSRELAMDLFHGILGILMVVGMLWLFDRVALRTR